MPCKREARQRHNVHYKDPDGDYNKVFDQMVSDGVISTRGLKVDAVKYGELVFDVNSAYFYNHGGYEFAKQFYEDAYKAAVEIVGGVYYHGIFADIYIYGNRKCKLVISLATVSRSWFKQQYAV